MRYLRYLAILSIFLLPASFSHAQVAVGVGVGVPSGGYAYGPPVCDYGYYDYAPYACAPYGYYGPEWFNGGIFIGAGPWFHGPAGFRGHVDNRFDVHRGYGGPIPNRGDHPDPSNHLDHMG